MPTDNDTAQGARVTIRTVAANAGVSVAAVSKVLRNAYGVSDALRQKVEASIELLGYRPSVAARGMRGQTFTLGVLLVGIDNPFLPSVYEGIESIAEAAGYKIMVGVGAAHARKESQLIEQMIDNRMDGLILVATQISGRMLDRYARQIPIVIVGHHEPSATSFDTVNSDDRLGAAMAVRALHDKGYGDIAMVALPDPGNHPADVSPMRELGYRAAAQDLGLKDGGRVIYFPPSEDPRDDAIRALLSKTTQPRAVFCWSDLDAIRIINGAYQMGLSVPEDIAIIGYDNSPVAALPLINLASMDQDGERLGILSAELLLSRMAGRDKAEHVLVKPRLVPRGSF